MPPLEHTTDPEFNFILVLDKTGISLDELENQLYESGCTDATLFFREDVGYLEFDRNAINMETAVLSAIQNVESAAQTLFVAKVEPGDLVTKAEISRRLKRSREYIRLLISGKRGPGNFPVPVAGVTTKTQIWSWFEVVRWCIKHNIIKEPAVLDNATVFMEINETLTMRMRSVLPSRVNHFIHWLKKLPA